MIRFGLHGRGVHILSFVNRLFDRGIVGIAVIALLLWVVSARGQQASSNAVPAYRQADNVAIITIKGEIEGSRFTRPVIASSVERRINAAVRAGANAIVFEIDTPTIGWPASSIEAALHVCGLIENSPVSNTVAWVRGKAYGGGALIAMACREMVVSETGVLGDAMPVQYDRVRGTAMPLPDQVLKNKLPPIIREVISSTRRHNDFFQEYRRDEYLAQAVVANDVELWWVRNNSTGESLCIDRSEFQRLFPGRPLDGPTRLASAPGTTRPSGTIGINAGAAMAGVPSGSARLAQSARDVQGALFTPSVRPVIPPDGAGQWTLIDKVCDGTAAAVMTASDLVHYRFASNATKVESGRAIIVPVKNEDDLAAFLGAKHVRTLDPTWSEGLTAFMNNFWVKGILIAIFLIALFIEVTHPGAVLPGVIAAVTLILLVGSSMFVGLANWWEVVAILLGIVLLGVEVLVLPGFGVAGVAGLVLLFGGLVGMFVGGGNLFPNTARDQGDLIGGITTVMVSTATAIGAMYFIARNIGSIPLLRRFVLKDTSQLDEVSDEFLAAMDPAGGASARVGETGVAITPLRPAGRVQIGDRTIDAMSESGFLAAGEKVRVVKVSGFEVGVVGIK